MASEDVIELGSSDDEVQPAPKRKKTVPNAMVHIPTNLHGVTIKPTTSRSATSKNTRLTKVSPTNEAVTVTKVGKLINPLANKNKSNSKTVQKPLNRNILSVPSSKPIANKIPGTQINPIHLLKKFNSQVVINKVPSTKKVIKPSIRINSPKSINNLSLGITVNKRPSIVGPKTTPIRKIVQMKHTPMNKKNQNIRPVAKISNEVLTVDLDDDDTGSSTSSPQWYLRPEDAGKPTMEEQNNKEPEQPKFVEITIEDSPVKPKPVKAVEDLLVTIEDSPVKAVEKKTDANSDEESGLVNKTPEGKTLQSKTPQSKKRLEYPKEDLNNKVIEIEIEPMVVEKESVMVDTAPAKPKNKEDITSDVIVEIEESPLKATDTSITSTPKKNQNRPLKFPEEKLNETNSENSEFHPVYENFIKLCFELENSEDMQKIVEKKVKTYYRQVPKEYTDSEPFIDMVSSKILAMKASPDKMYLFIKDIVDELNLQRKMAKTQLSKPEKEKTAVAESDNFLYGENSEFDSKRQRQIRKLEKTLKKLHRAIQKLEEQEVDFDDEEDSVYLLTERYKERMMRVHAKFCQLTNTKMPSEPRVQLEPRPGHPAGPAKKLEKWINKKVPIGTPLPFPDFHDVLRCVKEANEDDKLGWNDVDIMEEARDLFTRCGKKLQRRRQENEWRTAASRISLDADPAENNEDLRKKLEQNKQLAAKKEVEVFNKFADKQNQLKLEAEEIGDKEAEESPVESEEEEIVNEESLENKYKRKERLKRLLQEKSKKNSDEKENDSNEKSDNVNNEKTGEPTTTQDVELKVVEDAENKDKGSKTSVKIADIASINIDTTNNDTNKDVNAKIDATDKLESDIDELHLLQKLYSENEVNSSTVDSSNSEAPISISDTLDSDSAEKKSVISIENSSYSESEINKSKTFETEVVKEPHEPKDISAVSIHSTEIVKETVDTNIEIECSEIGVQKKRLQSNNDEYNESVEDILLASSDDEVVGNDITANEDNSACGDSPGSIVESGILENPGSVEDTVNLKDDNLSIGETVVGDATSDITEQVELNKIRAQLESKNSQDNASDDKLGNENMDTSEGINKEAEDTETAMQVDAILNEEGITHRSISNEDNVQECVSLDDDSSAGETADKNESHSLSQGLKKVSKSELFAHFIHHVEEEDKEGEKISNVIAESCSKDGQNMNDIISAHSESIDGSIGSSNKTGNENVDGFLKESKLTEGLPTIQTTT